jgi:hypothetical protein
LARLLLHVADWNGAARRLYESLGFVATGATEPLPHEPSVTEIEMAPRHRPRAVGRGHDRSRRTVGRTVGR